MGKTYTELEAWAIFAGALVIGVVMTSLFWAYITVPEDVKIIKREIENSTEALGMEKPNDFISFCKNIDGASNWDNAGFRQCTLKDPTEKNVIVMNLFCKKFNLSLSYGSFGVKCEGKI